MTAGAPSVRPRTRDIWSDPSAARERLYATAYRARLARIPSQRDGALALKAAIDKAQGRSS